MVSALRLCVLCEFSVPTGLARLQKCGHQGHVACLSAHVAQHGRCPYQNCATPATRDEVLSLHIDRPKGLDELLSDVFNERQHELSSFAASAAGGNVLNKKEFEEMEDLIKNVNQPGGHQKLKDFLVKAGIVSLAVALGFVCWYFAPPLLAVGASVLQSLGSMVMGLASTIVEYFPFVTPAVLYFSTFVTKSKVC